MYANKWLPCRSRASSRRGASRFSLPGAGLVCIVMGAAQIYRSAPPVKGYGGTAGAILQARQSMRDEYLELPGTREEMHELLQVLVNHCECGCSFSDNELCGARQGACDAARALNDRRFVLGLLYVRHLRPQLLAEEWTASTRKH